MTGEERIVLACSSVVFALFDYCYLRFVRWRLRAKLGISHHR